MKYLILLIFSGFLLSCSNKTNTNIESLFETISNDIHFNKENIYVGYHVLPKRYGKEYRTYALIHYQIEELIGLLDSLKQLNYKNFLINTELLINKLTLLNDSLQVFNKENVSSIILYKSNKPIDTLYSNEYLDNLMKIIDQNLATARKQNYIQNLDHIKLNLALVEKDVLYTLNRLIDSKTYDVNYIEPLIIKKENYVECYITSMDTLSDNLIIIGEFDEIQYGNKVHYKLIKPYDTIVVDKAKASISNELFNKGDVILEITLSDMTTLKRKLN